MGRASDASRARRIRDDMNRSDVRRVANSPYFIHDFCIGAAMIITIEYCTV